MGILTQQSVGDIIYYLIDDMAPAISGTTGDVAISTLGGGVFTCDEDYTWSPYINDKAFGSIFAFDHADASFAPTTGSWFNMNSVGTTTTWSATTETQGFTLKNPTGTGTGTAFQLDSDRVGRYLAMSQHSFNGTNARWNDFLIAPIINNFISTTYNGGSQGTQNPGTIDDVNNMFATEIYDMDSRDLDYAFLSYNRFATESAGTATFDRRHNKLSMMLIDQPVIFRENGVSEDFTTNGWTVVNDSTNAWVMGTGTTFSGGGTSMYISDDGSTYNYDNSIAQVSHFYKDITFPLNLDSSPELRFYYNSDGEITFDYGKIYFGPVTGMTPTAGTELANTYQIGLNEYQGQATFSGETITLGSSSQLAGETKRLVFSWVNDGVSGTQPPMAIDSLRIHFFNGIYIAPPPAGIDIFNETWETGSMSAWTVTNNVTNQWEVGTAVVETGTYGVYGSDDGGTTSGYDASAFVSHFYRDIVIPSSATTSEVTLTFSWNCNMDDNGAGATQYDYGTCNIIATGTTPAANTEVSIVLASAGGNGRINQTGANIGKFNADYRYGGTYSNIWFTEIIDLSAYIGQTKRLVFSYKGDGAAPQDLAPAFAIDNISLSYQPLA